MKKTILAIAISFVSFASLANGYCNSRPSQAERDNCYRLLKSNGNADPMNGMKLSMAQEVFDLNRRTVERSPKLTSEDRAALLAQMDKFSSEKGGNCNGNMVCLTKRVMAFNDKTKAQFSKLTAQ